MVSRAFASVIINHVNVACQLISLTFRLDFHQQQQQQQFIVDFSHVSKQARTEKPIMEICVRSLNFPHFT